MPLIYENDRASPLKPGDMDGMQELMEGAEAPSSTDWDIAVENPPHKDYDGPLPHPELTSGQQTSVSR